MSHSHSHGMEDYQEGDTVRVQAPQNFLEACMSGSIGVVIAFYGEGSVTTRDQNGATALHWAAIRGHPHIVRFLLDNGAQLNCVDKQKQTPLHWACSAPEAKVPGAVEVIHVLLDAGADPLIRDAMQATAHGSAAVNDNLRALHALCSRAPPPPNLVDADGNTPLAWACYRGRLDIARYCHEVLGIPANTIGKYQRTPLHWAAREGHADCCQYLIGLGLDPAQTDEGDARSQGVGFSSIHWAEDRHHVEAAKALRERRSGLQDRNTSTVKNFLSDIRNNGLHSLLFVSVVCLAFVCTLALPPFTIIFVCSLLFSKNTLYTMERRSAIVSHKAEASIAEAIGMPKDMDEAIDGPKWMHRREFANCLLLPMLIGAQLYVLVSGSPTWLAQWTASHALYDNDAAAAANKTPIFFIGAVPQAVVWCLLGAKIFAVAAKALSGRNVMASGTTRDFPLWKAIDDKHYDDVATGDAIFDSRVMLRKPARAFYCEQLGVLVKRFDSWSNLLDAPLSSSNMRWFLAFVLSVVLAEWFILRTAWEHSMTMNGCSGADAKKTGFYGWCSIIPSLLLNAAPCPSKNSWLGGKAFSRLSWRETLLGSDATHSGLFLIVLPICIIALLSILLLRKLHLAANAASQAEVQAKMVPSQHGGLMRLQRTNGGYGSVYGEGSAAANLLLFLMGRDGDRWVGAMTVPSAQRPAPVPNPFVIPPGGDGNKKNKRGGHH